LEDKEVKINGFIRSVRKQKRFAFAEISDGSTVEPLQAILKPAQAAEYVYLGAVTLRLVGRANTVASTHSLSTGTAVEISGLWKACPPGKEQTHELQTTEVTVVGGADPEVCVDHHYQAANELI
jgi:asparaginyl-tRNA synthetase